MSMVNEDQGTVKMTLHSGENSQQLDELFNAFLTLDDYAEEKDYEDEERNQRADEAYAVYKLAKDMAACTYEPHYTAVKMYADVSITIKRTVEFMVDEDMDNDAVEDIVFDIIDKKYGKDAEVEIEAMDWA